MLLTPPAAPPPTLEVYYSPSCTPCRLELPVLADFVRQDGAHLRIVILAGEGLARETLRAVSPRLERAAVTNIADAPTKVLHVAGDAYGILPYTRSIAANGAVCAQWAGVLTLPRIRALIGACARRIISPPSHRS